MQHVVCAVYDAAVGQYLSPFVQRSKMEALRSFKTAANNREHDFYNHAKDYTLFALGDFDPDSGKLSPYEAKQPLGTAIELIEQEAPGEQLQLVPGEGD